MTSRLSQSQQSLENLNLRLSYSFLVNQPKQPLTIMISQLVVEPTLRRVHFAIDCLLGLSRKFLSHLLFGSTQNKRTQRPCEQFSLAFINRPPVGSVKF